MNRYKVIFSVEVNQYDVNSAINDAIWSINFCEQNNESSMQGCSGVVKQSIDGAIKIGEEQ